MISCKCPLQLQQKDAYTDQVFLSYLSGRSEPLMLMTKSQIPILTSSSNCSRWARTMLQEPQEVAQERGRGSTRMFGAGRLSASRRSSSARTASCTGYSTQCTGYSLYYYTVHTVQGTVHIKQYTVYKVQGTLQGSLLFIITSKSLQYRVSESLTTTNY